MRASGILLPVSSLPTKYGIGGFSQEAYQFVDRLVRAGQKIWQILPIGLTGYGDSPYQSFSTFACNPYFISLDTLREEGLLTEAECEAADCGQNPMYVDYGRIFETRYVALHAAFVRWQEKMKRADAAREREVYDDFVAKNSDWLPDYALYAAIKEEQGGAPWLAWPQPLKMRDPEALAAARERLAEGILFRFFLQFKVAQQWFALKMYANLKGIRILGDVPIYVAMDSADAWADPSLFQFDEDLVPRAVAGCPPDAFATLGQLWGNPLYDWPHHRETGYVWWVRRMQYVHKLYDIVRIDHFRGFESYYSIPYGEETALNGHWEPGPGMEIFRTLEREVYGSDRSRLHVIAEDLGFLTDAVRDMVRETGYPGMKVLQFGFDGDPQNEYLPHNYIQNNIVYTGTHDNDTTRNWYASLHEGARRYISGYLDGELYGEEEIAPVMIRAALSSVCDTAVIPMWDYLNLGAEARFNTPSTLGGTNWQWRMQNDQFTDELADAICELARSYGR